MALMRPLRPAVLGHLRFLALNYIAMRASRYRYPRDSDYDAVRREYEVEVREPDLILNLLDHIEAADTLLSRVRNWDALSLPGTDGGYWSREIDKHLGEGADE